MMFKVLQLSESFSFADLMRQIDDFKRMISSATPMVTELLNTSCFTETESTKMVDTLLWPRAVKSITYRSYSCIINKDELQNEIKDSYASDDLMIKAVTVRVVNLDWIMNSPLKFLSLTRILNSTQYQPIFVTEFIIEVLNEFWNDNFWKLFWQQFIPFIACLVTTVFYLHFALFP